MVRPLLFFFLDRPSGEPDLVIVDHKPTDGFEGVPWFELNDFDWHGGRGVVPRVAPEGYAAFDLEGQVLNLVHATDGGVEARHHLASHVEWVLVASGTYDLPRLQELATRAAKLIGFEPTGEDRLLEIVNRKYALDETVQWRQRRGRGRRLFRAKHMPPPPDEHHYAR